MEKANQNIRKQIKGLGLYQWQLADAVGVSNYSFTIWMRHEMTGERLARVQAALDELKKQYQQEDYDKGTDAHVK